MRSLAAVSLLIVGAIAMTTTLVGSGCTTAPRVEERASFASSARLARTWFERNVPGLRAQIDDSAGYIIFPEVAQWGILISGGRYGRGTLNRPSGQQIGWASLNSASAGLQAGVQGFKMLIVLEDDATVRRFKENRLSGAVSTVVLAGDAGGSSTASFEEGVAVYQGANSGLMAGVNIGLDYVRYEPSAAAP